MEKGGKGTSLGSDLPNDPHQPPRNQLPRRLLNQLSKPPWEPPPRRYHPFGEFPILRRKNRSKKCLVITNLSPDLKLPISSKKNKKFNHGERRDSRERT